jgi:hypothetical protein
MIIEVVGKEIEKIKGDFESYLNGLNMVGEISYSQYSELNDEGTKQIQKAYELGNKANEWHYPSKGELPECDETTQLIFYVNCYYEVGGETLTRKRMVLGYYKKSFLRDDMKLFVEKSKGYEDEHLPQEVIAWKEIVLPELKESE